MFYSYHHCITTAGTESPLLSDKLLEEIEKPANLRGRGGVWFMTSNLQLHVGVDPDFHPAEKAHVAFEVDELAGVRLRLGVAGYDATDDEPLPGYDRCYVKDPFGNRMELLEPQQ